MWLNVTRNIDNLIFTSPQSNIFCQNPAFNQQ